MASVAENGSNPVKELIELALASGRHLQSSQTNYIHYHYQSEEHEVQHSIPILENMLFALALMRSRIVETITEGKELLSRLIAFQDFSSGNFPVYLHDYPRCKDPWLGIRLFAPLYWILKQFGHVLGIELKNKVETVIRKLLSYTSQLQQGRVIPYSLAVRCAAAYQAFGDLWEEKHMADHGAKQLWDLCQLGQVDSWYSTEYLSDLLIGLQMVYPNISNSPWKPLWQYINQTWHCQAHAYVGPCIREEQEKERPLRRLYDLFLGSFLGHQLPQESRSIRFYHLHAALIQASEDKVEKQPDAFKLKGTCRGNVWTLFSELNWACTVLEKKSLLDPVTNRLYTPFRLVWGDAQHTHTLVCQGGEMTVSCNVHSFPAIDLDFILPGQVNLDDRDKQREINFYLDFHPEAKVTIEGNLATTFGLEHMVMIRSGERIFSILFSLIEGEGQFLGHLMRANRPSQIHLKGDNRFNAYDWHIFLRTIRRHGDARLRAKIFLIQ